MGVIVNLYKKKMLCRYDKDGFIPYLSAEDFPGLICRKESFVCERGIPVAYYFYHFAGNENGKLILFCHGLGPGHIAYVREIEYFCRRGYRVLTLDYIGCNNSGGKDMISINEPTKTVIELIKHLGLKDFAIVGHSLGGYTALNVINFLTYIKKAVIISGFLSEKDLIKETLGSKIATWSICRYEKKTNPKIFALDNISYLKTTDDKILFLASKDDAMVKFSSSTGFAQTLGNPNLSFIVENGKKHNPNYSLAAVTYMNNVFCEYALKQKQRLLKTAESKKAFFSDKSPLKMTEQDEAVMSRIIDFIG